MEATMVISPENRQRPPDPMEATASLARSLHNFSSFPILKTWGHRKVLRCLNVNRKGQIIGSHQPPPAASSSSPSSSPICSKEKDEEEEEEEDDDDDGLEKVRAKLLVHLQEAADKMNLVTTPPPSTETEPEPAPLPPPPSSSLPPWNLRKKAAPAKAASSPPPHEPQPAAAPLHVRTVRLRSEVAEKKERPRFSISLSMREIDEDIYAVTGTRARRRPRKRPRAVQKQLDMLFPGSWLTEITAETYKVPE